MEKEKIEKEKIEKEKIEKEQKEKEKAKILGIYCVAFALSTFFAFFIFFIIVNHFLKTGVGGVGAIIIVVGLPAAFLIGDFIYFLRQIKEKVEYEPFYAFVLFISGATAFLFFLKMFLTVPI